MANSRKAPGVGREDTAEMSQDHCPWCDQPIPHAKFEDIQKRIRAEERRRSAELEAKANAQVEMVRKQGTAALEKAKKAAELQAKAAREEGKKVAAAEMALKLAEVEKAKTAAEKQLDADRQALEARLQEQRNALEKDKLKAINSEKANAFKERQRMDDKLQLMQRQLQKKTANELGEGAELDLFDELRVAFPSDEIKRVKRGGEGADIIHTIIDKKRNCGSIVYDSKNRTAWRNDYVSKLRRDQLAAKADHSILVCHVFPAGVRQLHIQDGVILANPARVLVLAALLRDQVVQLATARLSNQARDQKTARLYDFITSEHCGQLFDRIDSLTDSMLQLEVKEKKGHDATWKQRGELIRAVQQARGDLTTEIDLIIAMPSVHLQKAT